MLVLSLSVSLSNAIVRTNRLYGHNARDSYVARCFFPQVSRDMILNDIIAIILAILIKRLARFVRAFYEEETIRIFHSYRAAMKFLHNLDEYVTLITKHVYNKLGECALQLFCSDTQSVFVDRCSVCPEIGD